MWPKCLNLPFQERFIRSLVRIPSFKSDDINWPDCTLQESLSSRPEWTIFHSGPETGTHRTDLVLFPPRLVRLLLTFLQLCQPVDRIDDVSLVLRRQGIVALENLAALRFTRSRSTSRVVWKNIQMIEILDASVDGQPLGRRPCRSIPTGENAAQYPIWLAAAACNSSVVISGSGYNRSPVRPIVPPGSSVMFSLADCPSRIPGDGIFPIRPDSSFFTHFQTQQK